jgi:hypothetical protein
MKEDKILYSGWGGLGDIAQFSSLPRRFTELGHAVYLSSRTTFRNPEIKGLFIDLNPYILGISDLEPNCGNPIDGIEYKDVCGNFIMNWEFVHGLSPETMYPELYYSPKYVKSISDRILLDVTATSAAPQNIYDPEKLRLFIQNNYEKDKITLCCFHDGIANPLLLLDGYDMVFVESIFHYCDLIHSCKKFVSLHSGGMVLASALKKHCNIDADCLITHSPFHELAILKHHHFYDNINYIFMEEKN